jgi:hypothetical protein
MGLRARKSLSGLAAAATTSIGLGVLAIPTASFGEDQELCPEDWLQLPGSSVCEWSSILIANEDFEIEIPAGATKIAAILVGTPEDIYDEDTSTFGYEGGKVGYVEQTLSSSDSYFSLVNLGNPSLGTNLSFTVGSGVPYVLTGTNVGAPKTVEQWTGSTLDQEIWTPAGYDWGAFYLSTANSITSNWFNQATSGQIATGALWDDRLNGDDPLLVPIGGGASGLDDYWLPGLAVIRVNFAPSEPPAPASAQYNGPIALVVQRPGLPAGTRATATAERMSGITRVLVDGVSVDFKIESDSKLTFLVPSNLKPGTYPVHFEIGSNLTLTDRVSVSRVASSASTYQANRLFANYQGDNQSVAAADAAAISSFISKYKNITSITCIGSTSGIPASPTDQALALSRAKNACDLIQKQVPGATITLKTSVGKGVGQKFRSVQVFLQGNS